MTCAASRCRRLKLLVQPGVGPADATNRLPPRCLSCKGCVSKQPSLTKRAAGHRALRLSGAESLRPSIFEESGVMASPFETVAGIIPETADIPREQITPESHAIEDLGIEIGRAHV